MNNLSKNAKKIIWNRLLDKGIEININDLDNYRIDKNDFNTLNECYDYVVNNYNTITIETEKTYLYTFMSRGFSIGCQPVKGLIEVDKSNKPFEILVYNRKLTDKEIYDFELIPVLKTT